MQTDTMSPQPWRKKLVKQDILHPAMKFIGGQKRFGAVAGLASAPLWYGLARYLDHDNPALLTAAGAGAVGYGAYLGTRPRTGKYNSDQWARLVLGMKQGSDVFTAPMQVPVLHQAVSSLPGFGPLQKDFLHTGIEEAPTDGSYTHLAGLAQGFNSLVGNVTGNRVATATRAIEGALIGSAFSSLLGVSPGTKKWITGVAATADALYGNKLLGVLGRLT